ncbi:hypothetical protein AH97_03410 [Salmonella enterica subsp. enterica]|nr:hypothetical protein [Salmonella enterica subsp. enterica serovar Hartford]
MGQKLFGMHESSRLNMSFKCSCAFNIIYIMRTSAQVSQKSACNRHHGIKRLSLIRSFVFDRQPSVSLLSKPE